MDAAAEILGSEYEGDEVDDRAMEVSCLSRSRMKFVVESISFVEAGMSSSGSSSGISFPFKAICQLYSCLHIY